MQQNDKKMNAGVLSQKDRLERLRRNDEREVRVLVNRSTSASEFLREAEYETSAGR